MTENAKPVRAAGDVASRWLSRAAILLVGVAAVLGWGASFVGLHAYGMQSMSGFTYWSAWLVPGTFDGAAFACTLLTYRSSINGRSSMRGRLLMWAFTGVSSWINWIHQPSHQAQIVAAGLPIAAVAVFDIVLIELRADFEARHGRRGFRLRPGLLVLRWMVDRNSTRDAFRRQVIDIPVEEIAGLGTIPGRPDADNTDLDARPSAVSANPERPADTASSSTPSTADIADTATETPSGAVRYDPGTADAATETESEVGHPDERSTADHADQSNGHPAVLVPAVPHSTNGNGHRTSTESNGNGHPASTPSNGNGKPQSAAKGEPHNGTPETSTSTDKSVGVTAEAAKPQLGNGHTTRTAEERDRSGPETIRLPLSAIAEAAETFARISNPSRRPETKASTSVTPRAQSAPNRPSSNEKPKPENTGRSDNPARSDNAATRNTTARTDKTPQSSRTSQSDKTRQQGNTTRRDSNPPSSARTPAKSTSAAQTKDAQTKDARTNAARTSEPSRSQTTVRFSAPTSSTASTAKIPQPQGQSPTRTAVKPQSAPGSTAESQQSRSMAEKRAAARRDYLAAARTNRPLTGAELGARYGLSPSWGRNQIAAARQEQAHPNRT